MGVFLTLVSAHLIKYSISFTSHGREQYGQVETPGSSKPKNSLVCSPHFGWHKVCIFVPVIQVFIKLPLKATWITLVGLPVYLSNVVPASAHPPFGFRDYAALALFATSFLFELVADIQKFTWRLAKDNKQHDQKFISSGLWSISRHPKCTYT
jgi:hypothetical protein